MLLHVDQGMKGRVFDLDTCLEVVKVISLDFDNCAPTMIQGRAMMDGLGTVEAYKVGLGGKEVGHDSPDGWQWQTYTAKGRFRFLPHAQPAAIAKLVMGADRCAKCGSDLVLRGDELCAGCRARECGQRHKMTAERIDDPFATHKCERCSAQAEWQVSDEVETTPEITGVSTVLVRGRKRTVADLASRRKWAWDKAAVVDHRHYCSKHYQGPRILDAKGEIMNQLDDISARPD